MRCTVFIFVAFLGIANAGELPVTIKGMDDGVKTTKQQDFEEAVMNAKLRAIEQAGVEISAITQVENFQMKFDMIESQSEAILLPGFQIIDIGYQTDGTYLVILSGMLRTKEANKENPSELYNKAVLLIKQRKFSDALELLDKLIVQYEGTEYAVKAYDCKEAIKQGKLNYKQLDKIKIPENQKFKVVKIYNIMDFKGIIHEVKINLYYYWRTKSKSFLSSKTDCQFDYSFSIAMDGAQIGESTAAGIIGKNPHPKLEVNDDSTGLTLTIELIKYWNIIEIWSGIK